MLKRAKSFQIVHVISGFWLLVEPLKCLFRFRLCFRGFSVKSALLDFLEQAVAQLWYKVKSSMLYLIVLLRPDPRAYHTAIGVVFCIPV